MYRDVLKLINKIRKQNNTTYYQVNVHKKSISILIELVQYMFDNWQYSIKWTLTIQGFAGHLLDNLSTVIGWRELLPPRSISRREEEGGVGWKYVHVYK